MPIHLEELPAALIDLMRERLEAEGHDRVSDSRLAERLDDHRADDAARIQRQGLHRARGGAVSLSTLRAWEDAWSRAGGTRFAITISLE